MAAKADDKLEAADKKRWAMHIQGKDGHNTLLLSTERLALEVHRDFLRNYGQGGMQWGLSNRPVLASLIVAAARKQFDKVKVMRFDRWENGQPRFEEWGDDKNAEGGK